LSYAEAARAADEVLKDALIHDLEHVTESDVRAMLDERKQIQQKLSRTG
jgi:hypothetical protein